MHACFRGVRRRGVGGGGGAWKWFPCIAKRFLDRDGDGKIQEEVTQIGMKLLGNLLKRR